MESSSSSDEEDIAEKERIQAAASEELILHMMDRQEDRKTFVKKDSLRKQENKDEQSDLVTTPEFREHVAKKLSAFLDRTVECDHTSVAYELKKMPESGGIRLLRSSQTILTEPGCERHGPSRVKKSTRKSSSDESSSEEERKKLASICVSGESILSSGEGAFKRKISSDVNDQNSVAKKNKLNGSAKKRKKIKGKTDSSGT